MNSKASCLKLLRQVQLKKKNEESQTGVQDTVMKSVYAWSSTMRERRMGRGLFEEIIALDVIAVNVNNVIKEMGSGTGVVSKAASFGTGTPCRCQLESLLLRFQPISLLMYLGKQEKVDQVLGSLHWHGESREKFQGLGQPSFGWCCHYCITPLDARLFFLSVPLSVLLYNPAFQISK